MVVLAVLQLPRVSARIVACDVGQGDAIILIKGSNQVLIDGGPSGEKVLSCLESELPYWDRTLELIVLTNTDFDHLNGLSSVVERYEVRQFVTADGVHDSQALERLRDLLVVRGIGVVGVEKGDTIMVGVRDSIELEVLWPPDVEEQYLAVFGDALEDDERKQILGVSAKRGDLNERSVVLLLREGSYRALLTGDSGFQTENELVKEGLRGPIDYLKVGHHGSKGSTGAAWLAALEPKIAVISVGERNRYGHPTQEVLEKLREVGATVRRTDEEGTVVVEIE